MRDLIWTIIVVWVVYKLYNNFFSGSRSTVNIQKNENHFHNHETTHTDKKQKIEDVEYTDYEEIK